jgi:hypothetical protein
MKLSNSIFNRPTTSQELMNICKHLNLHLNGILMKDQLTTKNVKDGFYIMNLNNHNESGSHWTSLFKKGKHYYYADSFGVPMPQTLIDNLKLKDDNVFFNNKQIQNIKSQRCGFYAIYFLHCIHRYGLKEGLEKYVNSFNYENTNENEDIIKHIFLSM